MLIRVEIPVDAQPVAQLLNRAFPSPAEAELVQALREAGQLTLSLVAVDDEGQCIGYLAFSPLLLDGNDYQWVALAPLAVDPAYQGQGIGQA
ncbi:MAG TPA: GNAT family N-acetyltransferase, partial [Plesiomonas shigelloides]|nr:GNAT family N-acetyltransferase [Plesiomonas shigelloides]